MPAKSTALTKKNIWETLTAIDVKGHLKQRGQFSYLPWADAWGLLMSAFPEAEFREGEFTHANGTLLDAQFYPDETARVTVSVTIGEHTLSMWLPVMDYNNNAIKNPGARDISDAKARCLVKALAMFGLGHAVYTGAVDEVHDAKPAPQKAAPKANGKLTPEEWARVGKISRERAMELGMKPSEVKTIGLGALKNLGYNASEDLPASKLETLVAEIKKFEPNTEEVPF
jgi:hypothetical protein